MYAIVETGGKQYRVQPGDTIAVERLSGSPGDTLDLDRVLLLGGDGAETRVGAPGVAGAVVRAEVVEHARGEKIVVFRFKSKVRYRRKTGHRQHLTRLRITDILLNGTSTRGSAPEQTALVPAEPAPLVQAEPAPLVRAEPAPETGTPLEAIEPGLPLTPPTEAETEPPFTATTPTEIPPTASTELPPTAGEAGPLPEDAPSQQGE